VRGFGGDAGDSSAPLLADNSRLTVAVRLFAHQHWNGEIVERLVNVSQPFFFNISLYSRLSSLNRPSYTVRIDMSRDNQGVLSRFSTRISYTVGTVNRR
jgi:hypothetical protein